jgi:DNA sulfur modification protein DndD
MTVKLSILGWSASNLRCPDHEISLCLPNTQVPYKATFIQMPNGTGKTTTLQLLRATLSGSAQQWTSEQIAEFRNNNSLAEFGSFVVRLSLNDKLLTFELKFDFRRKEIEYRTTYNSGIQNGFFPPSIIKKFLNIEFVSLFIFDGELARNLLDDKQTRARDAIDALFQLSLFDGVASYFQANWEAHAANTNSTTEQGLNRRKNKLKSIKQRKKEIQAKQRELHLQKSQLKTNLQKAEAEYETAFNQDKNLGTKLKNTKEELANAEKAVSLDLQQSIEEMRNPQKLVPNFGSYLLNLKDNLDSLKLPTSTSQQFFEELACASECVCGRPMDEESSTKVRERASQYLAEDEVAALNIIKSNIAKYCRRDTEYFALQLQEQLEQLGKCIRLRDNKSTEISAIEKQRIEQGDSELEDKKAQQEKLKSNLKACEEQLKEIERIPLTNPKDDTKCLKELDRLIKQAEEDVAQASNTLNLLKKTQIIQAILTQSHKQAREKLRRYMIDGTNQRVSQLLTRNPVVLDDIQNSLKLKDRKKASEGQTLSVAYAFLATIFNQSTYKLPFIVDSPAISLDLNVRREVASFIPDLFEQFFAFTISSERNGFIDTLHQTVNEEVHYLTLFSKVDQTRYLWQNQDVSLVTETSNGILIEGKDFFEQFDLEQET